MANDNEVVIRKATPDEISSFIIPTWMHSYALSYIGKLMRADARHGPGREAYWKAQRSKIERILSTSTVSVRVAEFDGTPIGWICDDQSNRTVHFLFTGRNFRRQGVAKSLLPAWFHDAAGGTVYTSHLPPPWYSRPAPDGARPPWREHVAIDLVSSL
jgi:hypothetical protein